MRVFLRIWGLRVGQKSQGSCCIAAAARSFAWLIVHDDDTWGKVDMGPTRQVEKPWAYRSCRKVHGREQKGHSHWVTD